eukprot:TRINITY_DN30_c0_g1_i1.p1 TRINITY_DN30_c0_g1~~TRINITY_DN30_c0_g1_i1.p1  ORF type:complete len:376 (+),score=138.66 TRINITY_DN30_c0_g1_i1:57-1130(+)
MTVYPITEPGLMGSIYDPETNVFVKHRVGIYLALVNFCTISLTAAAVFIPAVRKRVPWEINATKGEALKLLAIFCIIWGLNITNIGNDFPRFPETWWLQYRLSIMLSLHTLYTTIYFSAKYYFKNYYNLPAEHCVTQAANLVRVLVKLSMFVYWVLPGHIFVPVTTHPLELSAEKYEITHHVSFAINSLYIWEVMFRELKPVNVIHHGIACIGFTSFAEWQNVLEPARTNTSLPILGSLIEGFCCLGSMCYRFMRRGRTLQRLMVALTIFVLVSYNVLLVAYVALLYAYCNLYSFGYGYICMPLLAVFTYPAQMNMAKVYWLLSKKAGMPETPVEPIPAAVVKEPVSAIRRAHIKNN